MPIYRDKARSCYVFEFDRRIGGQRIRVAKTLPRTWSRAQADAFDRRESERLYSTVHGIGPEPDIEAAVACYLTDRVPALKAGKSITAELALIYWAYQGRPLSALPDVCKAIAIKSKHLAPATIRKRIRYLTSACRWGWKHAGMGQHDPAERVIVPSVSNQRQGYIDRRQMLQVCLATQHRPTRAAIRIAYYSGMRLAEVLKAERRADCFVLADTKNGRPRIVPMHPKISSAATVKLCESSRTSAYFRAARDAAGLPWLHFHDLRHSAASAMINDGVDLYTVGAVLGHKSPASTQRYAHLATESLRAAIGKIGRKAA